MSVQGLKSIIPAIRLSQFLKPLLKEGFSVFLFLPLAQLMAEMIYWDQVIAIAP